MKKIFAASFLLLSMAACQKTDETKIKCWTCSQDVVTDNNGQLSTEKKYNDVCGLNEVDIESYKKTNSNFTQLNKTYQQMTCIAKDSI